MENTVDMEMIDRALLVVEDIMEEEMRALLPQSKIDSLYQSNTEKGIRKVCCELLDLKDAVENLCGDMQTKYLAFLRMSEEVVEMEHELVELRKHISAQGILVQDLMTGDNRKAIFLENFDVLLADHKVEEAIEALEAEERKLSRAERSWRYLIYGTILI
ncbi:EXOCYST COMPLEX COMPONENT 8 [Salix koriyanagi]|uniref:EXOCYST COMPLEX COMPONENT 8 n=1 Tax=Salix koriyanagi TaxID=2511006 RepID=A0A9Q0ST64_9ROSI|nr:EXOCYST COMPLEX COMPONENT 8 [Salix koriyanagi]